MAGKTRTKQLFEVLEDGVFAVERNVDDRSSKAECFITDETFYTHHCWTRIQGENF